MTIKRFLLVADALAAAGTPSIFLELNDERDATERYFRELGLTHMPTLQSFDTYRRMFDKVPVARERIRAMIFGEAKPIFGEDGEVELGNLIHATHRAAKAKFQALRAAAGRALDDLRPGAVVYDTELLMPFTATVYEAEIRGITTVSMQHAEGWTRQYSKLPLIANRYVAYSPYNQSVLEEMGAKADQIWLTGAPETDVLFQIKPDDVKQELASRFGCDREKRRLLVPLRPNSTETLQKMNRELLEALGHLTSGREWLEVLVKEHPNDYQAGRRVREVVDFSRWPAIKVADSDYSISRLLKASNWILTYKSAVIVEAVLVGLPILVIDDDHNALWPNWNEFNVYESVDFENLARGVDKLLGRNPHICSESDAANRQRFVNHFRFRFDDQAGKRIASHLTGECGRGPRP